jgi:hypothetical protein
MKQFDVFCIRCRRHEGHAGDVSARTSQAGNDAGLYGVGRDGSRNNCQNCSEPGDPTTRTPMVGTFGCCACAASGHAAALPRSVMNSRRLIGAPRLKREPSYRQTLVRWKGRTCPLWVKSRHLQRKRSCPLYPRKRTCAVQGPMSALGQYLNVPLTNALWALKGTLIVSRFVWLNPR